MQIWQFFIVPRHPVAILVTAFTRTDKFDKIKCDNKIKQVFFMRLSSKYLHPTWYRNAPTPQKVLFI